ncbi:MAG: hypothetical protein ABSG21_15495 [Spirochaetia bacterium]|jgi:hypothetical protein
MTEVRRRKSGIPYAQKWFARRTAFTDAFRVVAYYQFLGHRPGGPFFRHAFSTILIDLQRDPDVILADMHKNVRGEIRRAEGEGLRWEVGVDPAEFAAFHNAFARERGIEGVDLPRLRSFGAAVLLTRAVAEGRTLAQHAYVVDLRESRARFLYSSSGRFDGSSSALVGRSNRWCHWKDMLYLREQGIRTYDLGGIAVGEGAAGVSGINDFKSRFGGTMVREDHWLSPLYALAIRIDKQGL